MENGASAPICEPDDPSEAEAAVRHLSELFDELPGTISQALEAARDSGDLLSSDRFQGIAEIIQNADDLDASQVRITLGSADLWVSHDGQPVRLPHVLGLATPWHSTKSREADTTGRFGIGLTALRSLSKTLEIHCPPYHVRLGEPTLSPVSPPQAPPNVFQAGWTVLRVPLGNGAVNQGELEDWVDRWDDAALLFLRRITSVALFDEQGNVVRELAISRHPTEAIASDGSNANRTVARQGLEAADGRSWVVYNQDVPTPEGIQRTRKETEATTPIAIALPQYSINHGQIYAGLPVTETRVPVFVNAQFDPLTNRSDFTNNEWNRALVQPIAGLWARAVLDHFSRDPMAAWQAIPLPDEGESEGPSTFIGELEKSIITSARQRVASQLSFFVPGTGEVPLSQLAVEAQPLEQILTAAETAKLAGLPAALPIQVRDKGCRWRTVLEDWRTNGTDIPELVDVGRALKLLNDETRSLHSTIALAAAGLDAGLNQRLLSLPCVIARDGQRFVPPQGNSPEAVAAESSPLAEQLGLVTMLHSAHLGDGKSAKTVLKWLRESGTLLAEPDDRLVVKRLAAAGRAGRQIETPLTDQQVQSLRAAFEQFDHDDQQRLGRDIGSAIWLQAFEFESKGRRIVRNDTIARPVEAYLPRAIDRETDSFAVAAETSPGILWLSGHYARTLRSTLGRAGIGAQSFLRMLGAERAPRLRPHPKLERRYASQVRGLGDWVYRGPSERNSVLKARDATFTLDDRDCPALTAAVRDISRLRRDKRRRRRRAAALLTTLARAWDRLMSDFAEVDAARDYYGWVLKGQMPAYWLWEVRAIAWLDDESGIPRRPSDLRLRTYGNEAIHGQDSADYLHRDLDHPNWREVLTALGVSGDPDWTELVDRLKELRAGTKSEGSWTPDQLKRETAVVYKALAETRPSEDSPSGRGQERLQREFRSRKGLVFTDLGWLPPQNVLAGPHIFGEYKAFAPEIAGTESLWKALGLRQPAIEDCVDVIRAIARKRGPPGPDDESILLETIRALESLAKADIGRKDRAKLRRLPLWTKQGWQRERPVYATDDPVLLAGLRDQLPMWEPGGEIQQFRSLMDYLRIEVVGTDDARVMEPERAMECEESTELFGMAIRLLREDLSRNEPELAMGVRFPWDSIEKLSVYIHSSLAVNVFTGRRGHAQRHVCEVAAKVDNSRGIVFVQDRAELTRVDTGGRAIATLFTGDARHLAQAWLAACDRARAGREARLIQLAEEQSRRAKEQTESDLNVRMEDFRKNADAKRRPSASGRRPGAATSSNPTSNTNGRVVRETPQTKGPPRVLVDPQSLRLVDPLGHIEKQKSTTPRRRVGNASLAKPKMGGDAPRAKTSVPLYSGLDRETVGMEILRMLFSSDDNQISDVRAQRGVGADAIDKLQRYYELKVSAGAEPDYITLTNAEVRRALTTPNFFLVVVSNIEGADARPKVRLIMDPLNQLQLTDSGSITLSGVRSATSLTYDLAPED